MYSPSGNYFPWDHTPSVQYCPRNIMSKINLNVMLFCLQHTILGKMAYAPTVGRLACGEFPSDPHGFWQDDGYGILSVFKKDWNRFGGAYLSYF